MGEGLNAQEPQKIPPLPAELHKANVESKQDLQNIHETRASSDDNIQVDPNNK